MEIKNLKYKEWLDEGTRRFGTDHNKWKFVCPTCGTVTPVSEWREAGANDGAIGFACIGRFKGVARDAFKNTGQGPCNYTGGGLFKLNPVHVENENGDIISMFDFAPEEKADAREETPTG